MTMLYLIQENFIWKSMKDQQWRTYQYNENIYVLSTFHFSSATQAYIHAHMCLLD